MFILEDHGSVQFFITAFAFGIFSGFIAWILFKALGR